MIDINIVVHKIDFVKAKQMQGSMPQIPSKKCRSSHFFVVSALERCFTSWGTIARSTGAFKSTGADLMHGNIL